MQNPRVVFTAQGRVELREDPRAETFAQLRFSAISTGTELALLHGPAWFTEDGRRRPRYPETPGYCAVCDHLHVGDGESVRYATDHAHAARHHNPEHSWPVPDGVPDEAAVWTNLGATVINGIRRGAPQPGERVVVIGLGVVGQLAIRLLEFWTPEVLLGLDHNEERCKLARTETRRATVPIEPVPPCLRGDADVVYCCTGSNDAVGLAIQLCRPGGRIVSLGTPRGGAAPLDLLRLHQAGLAIVGACSRTEPAPGKRWDRRANGELFLTMCAEGDLHPEEIVTHVIPWHQAAFAYEVAGRQHGHAVGVLLDWRDCHEGS